MENSKFWNEANDGCIRQQIVYLMEQVTALSRLAGKAFYDTEDAIVDCIKSNKEIIFREVNKEYLRDDVIKTIEGRTGKVCSLSIEEIDTIVDAWQCELDDCDSYWAVNWDALIKILDEQGI